MRLPGDRLQAILDDLIRARWVRHAVLAVETFDGSASWAGAAGHAYADAAGAPMSPDIPYFIASIDKLYTATAILKLRERGQLDLDAPISAYLASELTSRIHVLGGVDRSDQITVRHLLGHTSGLPDHLEDRPRGGPSLIERLVAGGADTALSIEDSMRTVREDLTPHFPPQDPSSPRPKVRYSDTNFVLLVAIIEALCGRPVHEVVSEFIFAPAGMSRTFFLGVSKPLVPVPAPAALWAGEQVMDFPEILKSLRSVYSTVGDQIASLRALLSGKLFDDPSTLDLMQQKWRRFGFPRDAAALRAPNWPIEYGLGMMRFAMPRIFTPVRGVPPVIGHTGSTGSWLFYCREQDLVLAGTVDEVTSGAVPFRSVVPRVLRAIAEARR